jgi:Domain of unknown function (DUF2341)
MPRLLSLKSICLFIVLIFHFSSANAWWDCNWKKRVQVTINNTSAVALANYELNFTINNTNLPGYVFANADNDFRAIDSNDSTLLNYYVESRLLTATTTTAWVRIPTLAAGASKTIYMYYDNAASTSLSNYLTTFSQTGIRVWTRNSSVDPTDRATYDAAFAASNDTTAGYGCKIITDWTNISNQNQFTGGSNSNILWGYLAFFQVATADTWGFRHGSDYGRGGGMYIDNSIIEEAWNVNMWWNFSYTPTTQTLDNANVPLNAGVHALRSDGAEDCCDGAGSAQFKTSVAGAYQNWNTTNLPSMRAPQCRVNGVTVTFTPTTPSFSVSKTVLAFSDPINNTTNAKYIPGARARYLITITNNTGMPADSGSIVITDPIPANTQLFVGDLGVAGSGPVKFTQGSPSSGLSYTFTSLANATDDVSFSNNSGTSYVYTPVNTGGFDAAVTTLRMSPKNAFSCASGGGQPTAQFEFDVGIK